MERQAKEDAIKRGLGSFGPQAAWLAGLMAPSSGITDTLGLYPADTSGSGEKLPSFGENIQNKQYLDALYQGLGLAGDAMYATTPLTGPLGILGGTALKGMGAVGKATKASKSLKSKKYGDYLYHITPTKNVKSIKERGLSPIETSNYTKGRALDDPYQEDPRVFAWTNPVDAMHFLNRMHGPFGTNNMDEFSILRIRKTNGGKWEKDLALDPHMAYSNVDEIQKATGEKGLVSVQTGSYKGIDSDDIIDHIEVKDLQKELGDFIPSDLVYPGKGSYTGVEYSDAVTDLMNKGGISTDKASKVDTSYRMQHQATEPELGAARLDDMTGGGTVFPDDIYSPQGLRYYGNPNNKFDRESYEVIQKARNNPDMEITIYRAVPKGVKDINPGDFVTPSKAYAKDHAYSGYGSMGNESGDIISKKVKVKEIYSPGNDLNEFGYYPETQKPIKAYHGSPHDFEKFDIGKMGSGEGFQAYGRGIYFAEAEDVAKGYRSDLAVKSGKATYDGDDIFVGNRTVGTTGNDEMDDLIRDVMVIYDGDINKAIAHREELLGKAQNNLLYISEPPKEAYKIKLSVKNKPYETEEISATNMEDANYLRKYYEEKGFGVKIEEGKSFEAEETWNRLNLQYNKERAIGHKQELEKFRKFKERGKIEETGGVYETDIYATPDELLDWDKPLSEQPKAVQEKLQELGNMQVDFMTLDEYMSPSATEKWGEVSGKDIYEMLYEAGGGEIDAAENILNEVGIKGIKYFDGFSRGKQSGTSNYVIFDTRILDIANKYGVAIPVAGAMLLSIDKGEKAIEGGRKDI